MLISESESESEEEDSNVFYSTWDTKPSYVKPQSEASGQSKLTLSFWVGQGTLSLFTDVKVRNTRLKLV